MNIQKLRAKNMLNFLAITLPHQVDKSLLKFILAFQMDLNLISLYHSKIK